MKAPTFLLVAGCMLATLPSRAMGQDSTKARTLFSVLPFRAAHFAWGAGAVPYLDRAPSGANAADFALMFSLRRYPEWSVGFSSTAVMKTDTTSYVAPGSITATSSGYHPGLGSYTQAFEVQRRWQQRRMIHGLARFAVGSQINSYDYYERRNGTTTYHHDGKTSSAFGEIGGGGEMNVARWFRMQAVVGYRSGSRMTIHDARGTNGGMTTQVNLAIGKF